MVPAYPSKEAAPHGTAVTMETLKKIADAHLTFPDGFSVHPKVMPQLQRRSAAITQGGIDWGTAEILALGSLLMEGRTVRLTGQDSRRGTFVQRFASVVDRKTGESYVPLKHLDDDQGKFHIFDSLLSEYAAMGFEYGYSVARPDALVLWEAQFGDFANGAQTIIDEFISSGQAKWTQKSGVTLLLPHGYEGQGPDHSSARIERFLQLAAEDSIAVAQPSTPASHFHLLRQHAIGERHRPLVIMTPKSMLRNKLAVSQPADFTEDRWRPVLSDPFITDADAVRRVILCSGKVRWDLTTKRAQLDRWDTAIIPVERLYPLAERGDRGRAAQVPEPELGAALGAGRAGEPGRLAVHGPEPDRRAPRGRAESAVDHRAAHPARLVGAVGGFGQGARGAAARAARLGVPLSNAARCTSPIEGSRSSRHAGVTTRSPWRGSPSSCERSSTSIRTSRARSSSWPPGWPGWTTTRTDGVLARDPASRTGCS